MSEHSRPLSLEDHGHEMVLPFRASPAKAPAPRRTGRITDTAAIVFGLALLVAMVLVVVIGLTDPAGAEHQLRGIRESMDAALIAWWQS